MHPKLLEKKKRQQSLLRGYYTNSNAKQRFWKEFYNLNAIPFLRWMMQSGTSSKAYLMSIVSGILLKPKVCIFVLQIFAIAVQLSLFRKRIKCKDTDLFPVTFLESNILRIIKMNVVFCEQVEIMIRFSKLFLKWSRFWNSRPQKLSFKVHIENLAKEKMSEEMEMYVKDVEYYPEKDLKLDWYALPAHLDGSQKRPVIIFIYGGAWSSGDKKMYSLIGARLSQEGFLIVIPNYRYFPNALVEDMIDDIHACIEWVKKNLANIANVDHIVLCGHSSGAHLAALTCLESPFLGIHSFLGLAGVYDIRDHFGFEHSRAVEQLSAMEPAIGGDENFFELSPKLKIQNMKNLDQMKTKFILVHGENDAVVPLSQSREFVYALQKSKLMAKFQSVPNCDHTQIVFDLISESAKPNAVTRIISSLLSQIKQ
jgi:acetyl esterase/lipase